VIRVGLGLVEGGRRSGRILYNIMVGAIIEERGCQIEQKKQGRPVETRSSVTPFLCDPEPSLTNSWTSHPGPWELRAHSGKVEMYTIVLFV
jgi:hypothetical protein